LAVHFLIICHPFPKRLHRMKVGRPVKTTTVESLVGIILNQLQAGKIQPSSRLPSQRAMAKTFGVSRSSIREALNTLSGMGYLSSIQGRGTFIREDIPVEAPQIARVGSSFTAGSILELMEARELLESKAAELAATRASKEDLQQIHEAVQRIGRSGEDVSRFFDADLAFHLALAKASGNQTISEMIKALIEKVLSYHKHFRATSTCEVRASTHKTACRLLACLKKGQGPEAAAEMRNHLNLVSAQLREITLDIAAVVTGLGKRP
jgi:GntR family transcriptional regulator, transcriptional repressor for pyruvate dehydrogenase complex